MIVVIVMLSIFCIYGFTNWMIAKKILTWLLMMRISISPYMFYTIYSICALSLIIMYAIPNRFTIRKYITLFSYYWMGIYFYLLLVVTIAMIIIGICFKFGFISLDFTRQVTLMTGWIVFFIVSGLLIYGRVNAKHIKLKSYQITVDKQTEISSLKVALISDIHLNDINNYDHLNKIVKKIKDINPDIVCIAGDFFDDDYNLVENPKKIQELLQSIPSKYGTYVCLGNHDAGKTYPEMIRFFERSFIQVLYDDYIIIDNKFIIAGRRDSSPIGNQGEKRIELIGLDEQNKDLPIIVLDHQPSNISEYNSEIDLVLCGHTHKGQVFPANYITKAIFDVDYGHYQKDKNSPQVIATSGAGTWGPPFRIGTSSEVVDINIVFRK